MVSDYGCRPILMRRWMSLGARQGKPRHLPSVVAGRGRDSRRDVRGWDVYTQVLGKFAGRRLEYTRIIDRRDELQELRWSCPTTGGFQRWLLTPAQGGTFMDVEMDSTARAPVPAFDKSVGRWFIKRWAEQAIDGLRQTLASARTGEVQARAPGPKSRLLRQRS